MLFNLIGKTQTPFANRHLEGRMASKLMIQNPEKSLLIIAGN